nr:MAG TPA: hypothetical protein [Caudoviricetes sp.]
MAFRKVQEFHLYPNLTSLVSDFSNYRSFE